MNNEESFVFRHQKLYFGGHTTLTNEEQGSEDVARHAEYTKFSHPVIKIP